MRNWIAKIPKFMSITCGILTIMLQSSCGISGSCNTTNAGSGNVANLEYLTPNIVPSLISKNSYSYVQIKNTSDIAITKISYSISNAVGGGSNIMLDSTSANSCSTIAAKQNCTLKLITPANTIAGSFRINASNGNNSIIVAQANQAGSNTIGVQQVQLNSISGANGITLFYTNVVLAGTTYVMITGLVDSDTVGDFNSVTLLDSNSSAIAGQEVISANLGAGLTGLSQGATFAILLPTPHTSGVSQIIKLEISNVSAAGNTSNIQISSNDYTLTTANDKQAIISSLPTMLYLTESNPSQSVTIYNTGTAIAQLNSLTSNNNNVQVTFSPTSIAPNETVVATFNLLSTVGAAINSSATLTYNDGIQSLTQNIDIYQDLVLPPTPTAGLTAIFSPSSIFSTTTSGGTISQQLTITNTGNTAETGFSISGLAEGFSLSNGISANPCIVVGNNITNTLAVNGATRSCDITVSFAGLATPINPAQNGELNIHYQYNNGVQAPAPATANYSYQVIQASAILSLTPTLGHDFGSILNNNMASTDYIFNLHNSGNAVATNLNTIISGTESSLFTINNSINGITNPCGNSLSNTNGNNSCQIGVRFGPTLSNAPNATAILNTYYTPYTSGATASTNNVSLVGIVIPAQSAIITESLTTVSGFANASGPGDSSQTAYQVEESNTASITYTLTNSATVPATDFYISENTLPTGWTLGQNNCGTSSSKITLSANNGVCSVTFNINSPNSGVNNFNLNVITLNYKDQAHPSGVTPQQLSGITYVNVYSHAIIAITTNGLNNTDVIQGESFFVIATLSGGYNVTNQTIRLAPATPSENFNYAPLNGECNVNSQNPSCTVVVSAESNVVPNQYTIAVSNTTSAIIPSPATVSFNVIASASLSIKLSPPVITIPDNGESISIATIVYTGSDPAITLAISSDNPAIAIVTTSSCTITAPANSCQVTVNRGGTLGGTRIQVTDGATLSSTAWISSATIALPQTGQTPVLPADPAIFGSDGYYHAGVAWAYAESSSTIPAQRFTTGTGAEDNCITDNLTGMMWIKDPTAISALNSTMSWGDALNAVADLNNGSGYCGHTDWQLPNLNQLRSLINYSVSNSFTWLNSQGFAVINSGDYWSSTMLGYAQFRIWGLAVNGNVINSVPATTPRYAFPVSHAAGNTYPAQLFKTGQTESNSSTLGSDGMLESGIAWPNPRFVEGSNLESNCVTDNLTGLMWLKDLNTVNNGQKATWQLAINITNSLNSGSGYCGHTDWRLPNMNEMLSLNNLGANDLAAWLMSPTNQGGGGFLNVQSDNYWTSTVLATSPTQKAWTTTTSSTATVLTNNSPNMTAPNYFWPVRGGN